VDPRLLRTFSAVVRLGSFSAAARELGYTQSAVSQHIVALEANLGTALVTRRPVAPTEAGQRLLEHAGPILLRLDAARADVARVAAHPRRRLTIGAAPLAASPALVRAVSGWARGAGIRELTVRAMPAAAVAEGVATGDLDIGLAAGIVVPSDPLRLPDVGSLRGTLVTQVAAVVAVPPDHPIAGRRAVRLAELADARWIDAPDVLGPMDELCATTGMPAPRVWVRYHGTDVDGLRHLLAAGEGLALLPATALAGGLVGVPVAEPELVHRVEVLHRREADPALDALVAAITG